MLPTYTIIQPNQLPKEMKVIADVLLEHKQLHILNAFPNTATNNIKVKIEQLDFLPTIRMDLERRVDRVFESIAERGWIELHARPDMYTGMLVIKNTSVTGRYIVIYGHARLLAVLLIKQEHPDLFDKFFADGFTVSELIFT